MSWVATAVIGSAVIGAYSAKKAAEATRDGQQYAADRQMEGFDFYKPYLEPVLERGEEALDNQLVAGNYSGQTYATMNNAELGGLNYGLNQARSLEQTPEQFMAATNGFVGNTGDLYNQSRDLDVNGNYAASALNNAVSYGMDSPQAMGMVDSIMRDDTRRVFEGELPQLERQASMSGNANSSRGAVADAIARRGYYDRQADVRTDVASQLRDQYLGQFNTDFGNSNNLNSQMGNIYNNSYKMIPQLAEMQINAGNQMQQEQQNQLNDARMRFESERDFQLNKLNEYNSGILNKAVRNTPANPVMVTADSNAAGAGGAMAGAGFGLDMYQTIDKIKNPKG
jgi:hypothetical protein